MPCKHEIRALTREIVDTHRRLYSLQTDLEELTGFDMEMDFYEGLLMGGDHDPISVEELDEALSHAEAEDKARDDEAVQAFHALFPEAR